MACGTAVINPIVTIAVCSRNRPPQLQRWLAHMVALMDRLTVPILIVEQSATATPLPHYPHLTHLHAPGRGLSQARNAVLAIATTPFVAFCDDDCLPSHTWLPTLCAVLHRHPDVAVVTGSTWPTGTQYTLHAHHTHAGYTTWAQRSDGWCCTALHVAPDTASYTEPVAVLEHLGQGNNMVVARQIARASGGFHPWLGAGAWLRAGEDVEFMLRLLCAHHPCMYIPALRLAHDAWQTPDALATAEHGYTVGMLAVHVWYALRGVAVARAYLHFRWHQLVSARHAPTTGAAPRSWRWTWGRATAWGWGIIGGLALAIRATWRWR